MYNGVEHSAETCLKEYISNTDNALNKTNTTVKFICKNFCTMPFDLIDGSTVGKLDRVWGARTYWEAEEIEAEEIALIIQMPLSSAALFYSYLWPPCNIEVYLPTTRESNVPRLLIKT